MFVKCNSPKINLEKNIPRSLPLHVWRMQQGIVRVRRVHDSRKIHGTLCGTWVIACRRKGMKIFLRSSTRPAVAVNCHMGSLQHSPSILQGSWQGKLWCSISVLTYSFSGENSSWRCPDFSVCLKAASDNRAIICNHWPISRRRLGRLYSEGMTSCMG